MENKSSLFKGKDGTNYLFPFILITSLFALWGFANDITNPMVAAFKNILLLTNADSALVQTAFYGGYCIMAIPAAIFIKKVSYKSGILMGLFLYSAGCFLFIPAGNAMSFAMFLFAYFIMTCGLSFLETTANPFILSLGEESSATRRLNFAQAFNPIGSFTGMMIAKDFILARLSSDKEPGVSILHGSDAAAIESVQRHDLDIVGAPYMMLGFVVFVFFLLFLISRLPKTVSAVKEGVSSAVGATFKRLIANKRYIYSVIAQAFYVGVQIMVWTFIIQYGENELGMKKETAQSYNMIAMAIFVLSRFVCTFLLKHFKPSVLLRNLAIAGSVFVLGVIFLSSKIGFALPSVHINLGIIDFSIITGLENNFMPLCLISMVLISACMSLMFPTIYGIALDGLGDDAKLGSAGLILAIGGGAILPWLQGKLLDEATWFGDALSATRFSFILPLLCFVFIAGFSQYVRKSSKV
ncbi:MAG: L-fucose:H+ symporter permease [Tannerella sp.]|jgi:FHS family L-fucose permease-like MFS transporter|nr:L-fucose:H+ symporter permease [Tannerella sp.]